MSHTCSLSSLLICSADLRVGEACKGARGGNRALSLQFINNSLYTRIPFTAIDEHVMVERLMLDGIWLPVAMNQEQLPDIAAMQPSDYRLYSWLPAHLFGVRLEPEGFV